MVDNVGNLGDVAIEVSADISKALDGLARAEQAVNKFDKRTTDKANAASAKTEQSMRELDRAADRLARSYSPLTAATNRYIKDLEDIDRLQRAGMMSAKDAAFYNKQAGDAYLMAAGGLEKQSKWATRAGAALGGFLVLAGGAALAGLVAMANQAIQNALAIEKMSKQLNMSAEDLQRWQYIGREFGLSAGQIEQAFEGLQKSMSKAATGSEKEARLFRELGVELRDAEGQVKATTQVLPELADGLSKVGDANQRAAAEMLLFGESGAQLDSLLSGGSERINELSQAADQLGIVLGNEEIKRLAETNKKLKDLKDVLSIRVAGFVAENANAIAGLADELLKLGNAAVGAASDFLKFVRAVDQNIAKLERANAIRARNVWLSWGNFAMAERVQSNVIDPLNAKLADGSPSDQGFASKKTRRLKFDKPSRGQAGGTDLGWLNAPKGRASRGGGGGRKGPDPEKARVAEMREAEAFQNQLRDFRTALLRALIQQSTDANLRADLERQLLDIEKEKFEGMLALEGPGGTKKYDAAQVELLRTANQKVEVEKRALIDAELAEKTRREAAEASNQQIEQQIDIAEYAADMAKSSKARREAELELLDLTHQLEMNQLDQAIAAKDTSEVEKDLLRQRKAHLEKLKALEISSIESQTRGPLADYLSSFATDTDELADALERIQVDELERKRQSAVQFADDIADAFGNAAARLANFESPLKVLQGLLSDLAATFTEEFITDPVRDWARRNIGAPVSEKLTGMPTGPEGLYNDTLKASALGASTQLDIFTQAVGTAASQLAMLNTTGVAPLATASAGASQELSSATPKINQFGSSLLQVLSGIAGGGGGGGLFGTILSLAGAAAGSIGGAGAGAGAAGASSIDAVLKSSDMSSLGGFAKGGRIRGPGSGTSDSIMIRASNGEHMINARAAAQHRPLLEAINAGRLPAFGSLGRIGRLGNSQSFQFGDINLSGVSDERSARRAAKVLISEIRRDMGRSARHGYGD